MRTSKRGYKLHHDYPDPAPGGAGEEGLTPQQVIDRIVEAMRSSAKSKNGYRIELLAEPGQRWWRDYLDGSRAY